MSGEASVRLAYIPPYDWTHVATFLATRAVPGVERVDDAGYARTVAGSTGPLFVRLRPVESGNFLELRVRGALPAQLPGLMAIARRTFDLEADPGHVAAVLGKDPLLSLLVARSPGLRVVGAWHPFECAVRAVLGQQVSVVAGRTLAARLVARCGEPIAEGHDGLTHLFPSAAALAHASLDGLGITGARIKALQTMARAVMDGSLDFSAPVDDVTARLISLPGFGPWTAQYIAMRALGHADALPTGDLVLRRVAAKSSTALTAKALDARAEAWRPYRGHATFYLWRAAADRR